MTDRTDLLRSKLPLDGAGLEIGPSYNPLVAKADGFHVESVDYTDAPGLRKKYARDPHVDVARIEEVDHVVTGSQTLAEAVGREGAYDYIVASHVIEHTPDMIGFLQSCAWLLKPEGVLLLAVPDKRHCFDALQSLTSTGQVLQAHIDGRRRPAPGTVFDSVAYDVVREGAIGWGPNDRGRLKHFAELAFAKRIFMDAQSDDMYRDVHVWRFVPSSFRLIIGDLAEMGMVNLRESWFHDSVGNEFYVSLSPSGPGSGLDRLTLAQRALVEHATIAVAAA